MEKECPVNTANIFSRLTFHWMQPMMSLGSKKFLGEEDMWSLPPDEDAEALGKKFSKHWKNTRTKDFLGEKAIIAPRILRNRTIGFASLVNFCVASSYFTVLYSLPLYFQAVEGSSAIRSGVETLPFIMAVIFALIVSSSFISKSGIYIPWLVGGTALGTLGAGLLIMLKPDSSQAFWAGIGFLAGLGPGMAWMIPFSAATAVLSSEDLALGTGAVALFQVLGGTITVSLAQSIYVNKFQQALFSIPNVDPAAVLSQGITSFRETVSAEALPAVIDAANSAISKTFIVATVFGGLGLLAVFGMDLNARIPVAQEGTEKPIIAAA